jgi:transcriptional regulator with XRE-family HTH domain
MATRVPTIQQRLGKNIQRLRKMQGLTQEALAEAVQTSRTYLGHIEQGRKAPSLALLAKIAKALKVPVRELF